MDSVRKVRGRYELLLGGERYVLTRAQMEELISSTYGMDGEAITSYLSSYDDDELREMIRESIQTMLANTYAENARQKVEALR